MINEDTLDKYFDPEQPWVRGLFAEDIVGLGVRLDDVTSQKLAKLTGWKPRDDMGHRYHNALVMMNITPEDVMYHHLYDFVKGWGERLDSLQRTGLRGDQNSKCFEHFHLFQLFRRHNNKGLNVDDMLSVAILTELTKQGRRDITRAVVKRGKALLEEEAYSTVSAQNSPKGHQTKTSEELARIIAQKRHDRQQAILDEVFEPLKASPSGTSTPRRGSSPMNWTAPSSSGKKTPADSEPHSSGGKSHGLSRSVPNTPSMTPTTRKSPQGTQPDRIATNTPAMTPKSRKGPKTGQTSRITTNTFAMTARSRESPPTLQPGRIAANTPAMTPRSRESPQTTQPDSDLEGEDFQLYMGRPRHGPDLTKELARMQRGKNSSTAHIGTADSPLADKGKKRAVLAADEVTRNEGNSSRSGRRTPDRVEARQALWKKIDRATPKPKATAPDSTGEINQEDIPTESDDDFEGEYQSRDTGRHKEKTCPGDVTLLPKKRSKESPTAHPPSPPKKNRVSSRLTARSVTPIGTIVIADDDDSDGTDDDDDSDGTDDDVDSNGIDDDDDSHIQQRQTNNALPKRDTSDEDSVPRPEI